MDPDEGPGSVPWNAGARMEPLARVVRERRGELGLRQSELADLAGCSARFVHTVEHEKGSVRLDKLLDVLEVLGLDLLVATGRGRVRLESDAEAGSSERP